MLPNAHLEREFPDPPKEDAEEMAFATAMRQAVDDLFTCEAIASRLQNLEKDEQVEELLNHNKQILVEHLVETAGRAVDEVVTTLDALHSEPENLSPPPLTERPDVDQRVE